MSLRGWVWEIPWVWVSLRIMISFDKMPFRREMLLSDFHTEDESTTDKPTQRATNDATRVLTNTPKFNWFTSNAKIFIGWLFLTASNTDCASTFTTVYMAWQDNTQYIEGRRCLRSASSPSLIVRQTRLSTGDRAFPVAASRVWNDLPQHVTAAESLPVFCSRLKTHLFRRFFPWHPYCCRAREVTVSFRTR